VAHKAHVNVKAATNLPTCIPWGTRIDTESTDYPGTALPQPIEKAVHVHVHDNVYVNVDVHVNVDVDVNGFSLLVAAMPRQVNSWNSWQFFLATNSTNSAGTPFFAARAGCATIRTMRGQVRNATKSNDHGEATQFSWAQKTKGSRMSSMECFL
jgi:hypothetical protein